MRHATLPDSAFHRLAAAFELADEPYYQAELPDTHPPPRSPFSIMEDVTEFSPEEISNEPDLEQIQYDIDNLYSSIEYLYSLEISSEEIQELKSRLDEAEADLHRIEEHVSPSEESKPQKKYLSDPGSSEWEEYLRKNPYPYEQR